MHNIVALSVRLIPALILHQFQARLFKAKTINTVDYLSEFNGLGVRDGSAACEGRELYGMGNVQTGTGQRLQHSRCRHPHCFIVSSSSSSSYGASSRSYSTTDRCLLSPLVERWANRSASALEPIASPFLVLSRRVIGASWLNRLLRRASVVLFRSASQITLRFNRTRRHFTFSDRLRRVSHSAFLSHRYYLEDI